MKMVRAQSVLLICFLALLHINSAKSSFASGFQGNAPAMKAEELAKADLLTLLGYRNNNLQNVSIKQFDVFIAKGQNSITKTVKGNVIPDDVKFIFRQLKAGEKVFIQKVKARNEKGEVRILPVSITIN